MRSTFFLKTGEPLNYSEFKQKYNIRLNEQQDAAVKRFDGQTLLLAVPGSGKTTVIVARLGYMIFCKNISPENILTMTYNVSAAADMKKRFYDKFPDFNGNIEFRTINGFCATVIMSYERFRNTTAFRLVEEHQTTKIIRALYLDMLHEFPSESTLKEIKTKLVYSRNMMLSDSEIKKIKIGELDFYEFFNRYRSYKQQNQIMDYDDQLEFALKILVKNPDILKYYQERFKYISVDEAQDTSKIQHMIIRLLSSKYKNIFMVGDEDQSIYAFRAAYPQALLDFDKVYPDAEILLMEKNYRSSADIVSKANSFIKYNHTRHDKNMTTDSREFIPIKKIILHDHKYQYSYILKMLSENEDEIAILYRNNDSAIPLIDLFDKNSIGFRIKESDGIFFTLNVIADIMNILLFSFDMTDAELFSDIYYKIGLKIKKDIIMHAVKVHGKSKRSFLNTLEGIPGTESWQQRKIREISAQLLHIRKLKSYPAIMYIVSKMEYGKYAHSRGMDTVKINTLLSIANQNPELSAFILRISELKNIVTHGSSDPESRIILSTIHSSKGLEYENVIMIDVADGVFPSVPIEPEEEKNMPKNIIDDLEEERRLFYVGVTRAKKSFSIFSYEAAYGEKCPEAMFTRQLFGNAGKPSESKKSSPKISVSQDCTSKLVLKTNNNTNTKPRKNITRQQCSAFIPGKTVNHKKYGEGIIEEMNFPVCKIKTRDNDIRSFDIQFCIQNDLIELI